MYHRPIHDEVMSRASRLASDCHPLVAERHADVLARYARVASACDVLESFLGVRPQMDDDVFTLLSQRRVQIADLIAMANLDASSVHLYECRKAIIGITLLTLLTVMAIFILIDLAYKSTIKISFVSSRAKSVLQRVDQLLAVRAK